MSSYPILDTQLIGRAESSLRAILDQLLARTGITFHQYLVLTVAAADGGTVDRDQLIARIASARKVGGAVVAQAVAELTASGMLETPPGDGASVGITEAGRAQLTAIRGPLAEITARLFADIATEDLATAGRVLAIVTARAGDVLAGGTSVASAS